MNINLKLKFKSFFKHKYILFILYILKNTLPILFSLIVLWTTNSELYTTIFAIPVIILTLYLDYHKKEILLFFVGVIFGFILELGSDLILQLQFWENASLFGIPYWLPLFWGLCFIIIRRIGNKIVE